MKALADAGEGALRSQFKEMDDTAADVNHHLLKIPATIACEDLVHVLETLWNTRSTGLSQLQKRDLQTRLVLGSLRELDPVLVCLRSMMRKSRQQDFTDDEIRKLFPRDLQPNLQETFLAILKSHRSEWGEQEPRVLESRVPNQIKTSSAPLWPRRDDSTSYHNKGDDSLALSPGPELNFPNIRGNLPLLKSMTWTIENPNSGPSERAAVVFMKLQYSTHPPDEVDLKFRVTRDTLEALVRSITYINDQFQLLNSTQQTENTTAAGDNQETA
ncbi:uncharacterized protein LOC144708457 isoform X1 [Wolffia australiana]